MRSRLSSWNTLATKLGFTRKSPSSNSKTKSHRKLRFEHCEERRMLTTITVNSVLDNIIGGDGLTTLREAIIAANQFPDADCITFALPAGQDTITLTEGELDITGAVTIDAQGQNVTIDASGNDSTPLVDDNNGSRIFDIRVTQAVDVVLKGLKLTGADANFTGGAVNFSPNIAGAELTIIDSTIEDNFARLRGGAVTLDRGSLVVQDSVFNNNRSNRNGGAVSTGNLTESMIFQNTIFTDNTSQGSGGAIYAFRGYVEINDNSLILNNKTLGSGTSGGGLFLGEDITSAKVTDTDLIANEANLNGGAIWMLLRSNNGQVQNVTVLRSNILDNKALGTSGGEVGGGGIFADLAGDNDSNTELPPELIIIDSTIDNNFAEQDGGGVWVCTKNEGYFEVRNSTVSNNTAGSVVEDFGSSFLRGGQGGGLWIASLDSPSNENGLVALVENTTVSGNTGFEEGGGAWVGFGLSTSGGAGVDADFNHVTITNNKSPGLPGDEFDPPQPGEGAGLFSEDDPRISTTLVNTIVSGNVVSDSDSTANNVGGAIESDSSHNLLGSNNGIFVGLPSTSNPNIHNDNHGLLPLNDSNGGRTATHKPDRDIPSLAIDAWDPVDVALAIDPVLPLPDFDQRGEGFPRVQNIAGINDNETPVLRIDIGAVELQPTAGLPPTILDIKLDQRGTGDDWVDDAEVSFAPRVADSKQFHSVATEDANTIEIEFSQNVTIDSSALTVSFSEEDGSGGVLNTTLFSSDFNFQHTNETATWTLKDNNVFPNGKYAIHLDPTKVIANGMTLDAQWDNDDNDDMAANTPDYIHDDEGRNFVVGDEIADTDEFVFLFAYMAGDYDSDHDVDGRDFLLWQHQHPNADGNGDGVIDGDDQTVWNSNFGKVFPLRALGGGDFNDDEFVGGEDYAIWSLNFGLGTPGIGGIATPEDGDIDGDGDVDGADFLDLQSVTGDRSAWYFHTPPGIAAIVAGALPTVTNVIISGSNSPDSPYDFSSILGTGEQLRSVPVSGADMVSIQFSEEVWGALSQTSLQLTNLDGTSPGAATDFSYDFEMQIATWTFGSAFADGRHLLTLNDVPIDLDGESLDGEINNPWSLADASPPVSASGDGEAGGDFRFRYTIMSGDTDHDNIVGGTDYTNWHAVEPGMILASNVTDELDADYSFGDVSLREAVQLANAAGVPTTIVASAGNHALTRIGTEAGDATYNDLDITGVVKIIGEGAGITVINSSALTGGDARIFNAITANASLDVSHVTLTSGTANLFGSGAAARFTSGATLVLTDSAVVNHDALAAAAISADAANITVRRSVFTNNEGFYDYGPAISVSANGTDTATLTIGESIFAFNQGWGGTSTSSVFVSGTLINITKVNEGHNLYDDAAGGFFDTTPGVGDYLGTPDFVVTSVADTFDHTDDDDALSLREAVDLANQAAGSSEVWLPAWDFVLTRDRQTYGGGSLTDIDVSFGDLDISESLVIRGVNGRTSVAWTPGVVDAIFDLLGDYSGDGISTPDDGDVDGDDYTAWSQQYLSTGGVYSADGDDDGDVDDDDLDIWSDHFGNTLDLIDILV